MGSIYYFNAYSSPNNTEISYNYGSTKKVIKVRLTNRGAESLHYGINWYYTEPIGQHYAFIT